MNKNICIVFLSLLIFIMIMAVPAQANKELCFNSIIEMALENNIELDIAKLELENARIEYKKNELANLATDSRLLRLQGEVNKMIAEQNFQQVKQGIVLGVLEEYLELITLNNIIQVNKEEVKLEKRRIKEVKAQVETGYKGAIDLFTQQNDYNQKKNKLEHNLGRRKRLIKILRFKTGVEKDYTIKIYSLPMPEIWKTEEEVAVETALKNSLSIKISKNKVKLAEAGYEKASVKNESKLSLEQIKNELSLARLNYHKERQKLEEKIMVLYEDYKQSVKNITLAKNSMKQVRENYKIVKEQQSHGLVTDNDMLAAKVNMLKAENNYINSLISYHIYKVKLQQAIGMEVEVIIYEKRNK